MNTYFKLTRLSILLAVIIIAITSSVTAEIAIVTNIESEIDSISSDDLRKLYFGQTTKLENKYEIILTEYIPRNICFSTKYLNMSVLEYRRYWLKLIYAGHFATPPQKFHKLNKLKEFLNHNINSIGYLDESVVDSTLKIIKVEDCLPLDK